MAILLSSALLAPAAPLKIKYIVCIGFVYIHAHKHEFSPINQCNCSGEGGHSLRLFKLVCKTHSPHLQCTPKKYGDWDFWHAKLFRFATVYNPLYDIPEYFIPNPQHSKTVKSGSLRSEKWHKPTLRDTLGSHLSFPFLFFDPYIKMKVFINSLDSSSWTIKKST